jgi:SnoaL-like protein
MGSSATPVPLPGWGLRSGALELRRLAPAVAADDALHRMLVVDRINRYGWAFDERDREALAGCFTADAIWEGNVLGETPVPPIHGREHIVGWLAGFWDRQVDQRRHMMLNVTVDLIDATRADALASLLLLSAYEESVTVALTSFYRLRLEQVDGDWLIAQLFEGFDAAFE